MKVGEHRGREIRFAEHVKQFEVGTGPDDNERFESYAQALAFIDKQAADAAKGRRLSLEATAVVASHYSLGDGTERVHVTITGVHRGSRRLTLTGIPPGREERETYVRHPLIGDLLDERARLQDAQRAVSKLLGKLQLLDGAGHGRIETVEDYERIVGQVEQRHAAALILADEIAKQRAAAAEQPSAPTAEIVPAHNQTSA